MTRWKKICCAVDFSAGSRLALDEAAYWARLFEAKLALLHVYDEPSSGWNGASRSARDAQATLGSWRSQAEFLADRRVDMTMLEGNPREAIVRFARDGEFDLVVVGPYGKSGIKLMVLGSVAEQIVRAAHCPVLVVRHRRREWVLDDEGFRDDDNADDRS